MPERKANYIQQIRYHREAKELAPVDLKLNIPFPVKAVRFINLQWTSSDGYTTIGFMRTSIPGCPIIGLVDAMSTNKSFEYVFASPVSLSGEYKLEFVETGSESKTYTFTREVWINIMLEFLQE